MRTGFGGWAAKIRSFRNTPFTLEGAMENGCTFDMELMAICSALEYLPKQKDQVKNPIVLRTDSDFACDGHTMTKAKLAQSDETLLLQESKIVQRLFRALYRHDLSVTFEKVRSHRGIADHDEVHRVAHASARNAAGAANASVREYCGFPPPVIGQMLPICAV